MGGGVWGCAPGGILLSLVLAGHLQNFLPSEHPWLEWWVPGAGAAGKGECLMGTELQFGKRKSSGGGWW